MSLLLRLTTFPRGVPVTGIRSVNVEKREEGGGRTIPPPKWRREYPLRKVVVELARGSYSSPDEGEIHCREGDGGDDLDRGVKGEVSTGVRSGVRGVHPSTDEPALRSQ